MGAPSAIQEPQLLVDVPAGFAGIPITSSGEDITRHLRGLVARSAESGYQEQDELLDNLGAVAHTMARENIRLFGRFAVADESSPEPALANLALAMPRLDVDAEHADTLKQNRVLVVRELLRRYRERVPDADVRSHRVALGPALIAQRAGEYHFPAELTHGQGPRVRTEFKVEFQIPSPDMMWLVIMTVTTGSEQAWPLVAAQARRVADSVRLEYPNSTEPDPHG